VTTFPVVFFTPPAIELPARLAWVAAIAAVLKDDLSAGDVGILKDILSLG
jgi:hypothetical protein